MQRNLQIVKQADNFAYTECMLVWDSFKCHISNNAKDRLKHCNTVMSIIPGGCTKILQPLHVSINKPFKEYFRVKYDDLFHQDVFEYTTGGNMKAPSHFQQIQWVVQVWSKVPKDLVIKSFNVCSITQDDPEAEGYDVECEQEVYLDDVHDSMLD